MSDESARLAARYPSLAGSPGATTPPATGSGAAPSAASATEAERLAKRYPSLAGTAAPAANAATAPATDQAAVEAERLAKRYPSHATPATKAISSQTDAERLQAERDAKRYPTTAAKPASDVAQNGEVPDGIDPKDPVYVDFQKVAGEVGLDKANAGRLLDLHQRAVAAQRQAWDAQVDGWEAATRNDPEIGGAAFEQSLEVARGIVKEFGTPALEAALDAHQYGSHPELVRLLTRVGRALRGARGRR